MEIHNVRDALSVKDSDIADSHFSNASLAKSRFDNVNLQHATFANANLAHAVFTDIDFRNASITDANLAGMRINGILIDEMIRAHAIFKYFSISRDEGAAMEIHSVRDALSVKDSDIADSHFSNASLAKSRFDNVNLQHATFANANLAHAAFTDIDFRNASISDANLAGMRINGILVDEMIRAHGTRSGAVLFAKDPGRVQAFYQAVLDLAIEHADDDHVVLASSSFELVVHKLPDRIAASVEIEHPPRRRTDTPIKPVFPVASIAAARATAPQHGGELFAPDREWEFRGAVVCDGVDPEGNVVQFRQYRC